VGLEKRDQNFNRVSENGIIFSLSLSTNF
jgi:hypothetical protein